MPAQLDESSRSRSLLVVGTAEPVHELHLSVVDGVTPVVLVVILSCKRWEERGQRTVEQHQQGIRDATHRRTRIPGSPGA